MDINLESIMFCSLCIAFATRFTMHKLSKIVGLERGVENGQVIPEARDKCCRSECVTQLKGQPAWHNNPNGIVRLQYMYSYSNIRNWLPCFSLRNYTQPHRYDDGEAT